MFNQHENGCFVAMKLIKLVKSVDDDIFLELLPNLMLLSKAEKGINVVKKLIPEIKDESIQYKIVEQYTERFHECIDNCYANYAIQTIIDNWKSPVIDKLYEKLRGTS